MPEDTKVEDTKEIKVNGTQDVKDSEEEQLEGKDDDDAEKAASKDEDLVKAKQLYSALKDPTQAPIIIRALAEQAGITDKREAKEASKTIMDVFKETLGPEYAFMADKLASAIDIIVNARVGDVTRELA